MMTQLINALVNVYFADDINNKLNCFFGTLLYLFNCVKICRYINLNMLIMKLGQLVKI